MATRLRMTRAERSEQTRAELIEAARTVFLRRGFHGASLDEISAEAGYTTGAVYSRFGGKDELFLAVMDEHLERRTRLYTEAALAEQDFEAAERAVMRAAIVAGREEPAWTPLLMEFWTHAARREELRAAVAERNQRNLDASAELHETIAARHGMRLLRSPQEMQRAATAMARGLSLERQIATDADIEALFEDCVIALLRAFTEPRSTP
jgi:AcrR family transcriptional regulator